MKVLLTNDWHFAVKNPVSRTDDYNAELFGLLDQIHRLVVHVKPVALCMAGDIFHEKGRALWSIVSRLLEWGQRVNQTCPILFVPGNHDQTHDRWESRTETPIGTLIASGIFIDVSRQSYPDGYRGRVYAPTVYGVPWPDGGQPDAFAHVPAATDLVLAHGFATEDGSPRYGQFSHKYSDLARLAPWVRLWHFGHDHSDSGVFTCQNGAKVVNIGALCRGALEADNLTRQVKVALADFGTTPVTVQQVALKTVPVEQIFDLQLRAQKVQEHRQVEQFVQQLKTGLTGLTVDFQAALAQLPLDAAVRTRVQTYIARAESV